MGHQLLELRRLHLARQQRGQLQLQFFKCRCVVNDIFKSIDEVAIGFQCLRQMLGKGSIKPLLCVFGQGASGRGREVSLPFVRLLRLFILCGIRLRRFRRRWSRYGIAFSLKLKFLRFQTVVVLEMGTKPLDAHALELEIEIGL